MPHSSCNRMTASLARQGTTSWIAEVEPNSTGRAIKALCFLPVQRARAGRPATKVNAAVRYAAMFGCRHGALLPELGAQQGDSQSDSFNSRSFRIGSKASLWQAPGTGILGVETSHPIRPHGPFGD